MAPKTYWSAIRSASISLMLLAAALLLPLTASAAVLELYPQTVSVETGDTFTLYAYVSSADQALNAVSGTIAYPANLLAAVSVSKSGSILTLWVEEPSFSNSAGTIEFSGVIPNPGFIGRDGKVLTMQFRALSSGTATLTFPSSAVLANDGQGTNILTAAIPATVSLADAPASASEAPPAPAVTPAATPESSPSAAETEAGETGLELPEEGTAQRSASLAPVLRADIEQERGFFISLPSWMSVQSVALYVFAVLSAAIAVTAATLLLSVCVWYSYRYIALACEQCPRIHRKVRRELRADRKKMLTLAQAHMLALRVRLRHAAIAVMLIAALGGAMLAYTTNEQRLVASALTDREMQSLAHLAIAEYEVFLVQERQFLSVLANLPQVEGSDASACGAALAAIIENVPRYANAGVILPDGRLWCSALPFEPPVDLSKRVYFERALEKGDFATGEYQVGFITHTATINFGYPVWDEDAEIEAIVFTAVKLTWLDEFARRAELPTRSVLTLVDASGAVLARYPTPSERGEEAPEISYEFTRLVSVEEGAGVIEATDEWGERYYVIAAPLGGGYGAALHLIISVPRGHVKEAVARTLAAGAAR